MKALRFQVWENGDIFLGWICKHVLHVSMMKDQKEKERKLVSPKIKDWV